MLDSKNVFNFKVCLTESVYVKKIKQNFCSKIGIRKQKQTLSSFCIDTNFSKHEDSLEKIKVYINPSFTLRASL